MQRLKVSQGLLSAVLFCIVSLLYVTSASAAGVPGYKLYVARFENGDMVVLDSATHKETGRVDFGFASNPVEILTSPDRKLIYVSVRGFDEIWVVKADSLKVKKKIKVGVHPNFMSFSPDGKYIVMANNQDVKASVIDTRSGKVVGSPATGRGSAGAAVTSDSKTAYVTSVYTDDISVIDLRSMKRTSLIEEAVGPNVIVIPVSGKLAYFGSHRDRVSVLDTTTNRIIDEILVGDVPSYLTLSADERLLFVVNYWSHNVSVVDLAKREVIATIKVGREPTHSALSPDGRYLFVSNYGDGENDGSISVIDVKELKEVDRIKSLTFPRAAAVLQAR